MLAHDTRESRARGQNEKRALVGRRLSCFFSKGLRIIQQDRGLWTGGETTFANVTTADGSAPAMVIDL